MIYILLLLLSACGQPGEVREFPNSEIQAIVERFEREITPVGSIRVEFVDRFDITIGQCITESNAAPLVQLLRSFWDTASDNGKEQLLFHELGHAIGIRHDETLDSNDIPISLMYPNHINDYIYAVNRQQYINDLKRRAK